MVDLNYGLLDTQFGQKLGAEFDPTVIAERQNKLMDLYNQRAIQNAAVAAAQNKQAAIANLSPDEQVQAQLGVPPEKIMERRQQMAFMKGADRFLGGAPITGQYDLSSPQSTASVMSDISRIADPTEKAQAMAALQAQQGGAPAVTQPDEQGIRDYAVRGVLAGVPGADKLLNVGVKSDEGVPIDIMSGGKAMKIMSRSGRIIGESPRVTQEPLVPVKQNDGTVIYMPRSQAIGEQVGTATSSDKPLTEFQAKDVGYGTRAQQAHDILNKVGVNYSPAKLNAATSVENVPGIGWAANAALGDTEQSVGQAQRNFINAVLRQESGAAIASSEFNNARKQYFPQPGDSDSVIAQKQANRERVIESFKIGAGTQGAKHFAPSVVTQSSAHPADINSLLQQYGTAR